MKPFELRLAELHSRNARHVWNLRAFCDDKERFSLLQKEDRELLLRQLDLMTKLDEVLEERMRRLNIPV